MTDMSNETFSGALLVDSDTNQPVSADELGLSDEQYDALVNESIDSGTAEGHVRVPGGSRRVYAPYA
jgi:hypothetical protein